ncbi:8-amino-7-oxononanoate synthase [Nannochloropsis oceanica]
MPSAGAATRTPVATALASMSLALEKRARIGKLRELPETTRLVGAADFTSNDYLGLARCPELAKRIQAEAARVEAVSRAKGGPFIGATGSRLLSGTTWYHIEVESWLANFFRRESALVFNSGYDLNLGLLACLTRPGDAVLFDELIHNSSVMGLRLGAWHHHKQQQQQRRQEQLFQKGEEQQHQPIRPWVFRHNDVQDLEARLKEARATLGPAASLFVAVEAIYSMDGDLAPLTRICDTAARHGACVIVDEAHSTGVVGEGGRGLVCREGLEGHPALLCSIHTFGKALGCHGAVLCGPKVLRDYCGNYCAPFIYSTAASFHSLASMRQAAEFQQGEEGERRRSILTHLVSIFKNVVGEALAEREEQESCRLLPSPTPIQAVLVPGNTRVSAMATALQTAGLDVRPLRPPTVPEGRERLRVVLHSHNTEGEIQALTRGLVDFLEEEREQRGRGSSCSSKSAAADTSAAAHAVMAPASILERGDGIAASVEDISSSSSSSSSSGSFVSTKSRL